MSSLNYFNVMKRTGMDYKNYYNDFNNEGHMYPLHGVGDLDKTKDIIEKIIKSISGKVFSLTDLGIKIKVTDKTLIKPNAFIDFHNIPTKHLDGSSKLPDGSRIEQHIMYFNKNATRDFPNSIAFIDWISGDAYFKKIPLEWNINLNKKIPTTLSSTRNTPYLKQDENLSLVFFMDGKQSRLTNGGFVNSYRYIAPLYATELNWFVAKAWVPCKKNEINSKKIITSNGNILWVRPRLAKESINLESISYNQNRYMETISKSVNLINTNEKINSFSQRYLDKSMDFGDIILVDEKQLVNKKYRIKHTNIKNNIDDIFNLWVKNRNQPEKEKQIAYYEMIEYASKILKEMNELPSPYKYVKENSIAYDIFYYIKYSYINIKTYDISISSLITKSQLGKSYMPVPVGDTGWMIVDKENYLQVPKDDGEYFIGWTIKTQPVNVINKYNNIPSSKISTINWCKSNGYKIHQGPGIIFTTGGDFAHHGMQEPYLLEHNYKPVISKFESISDFKIRKQCQIPNVHWRLDKNDVIKKSNIIGTFTETNVGAAQNMLLTIGTKSCKKLPSKSQNFLGRNYQYLLSNPKKIQELLNKKPKKDEVYKIVDVEKKIFSYGLKQNNNNISY